MLGERHRRAAQHAEVRALQLEGAARGRQQRLHLRGGEVQVEGLRAEPVARRAQVQLVHAQPSVREGAPQLEVVHAPRALSQASAEQADGGVHGEGRRQLQVGDQVQVQLAREVLGQPPREADAEAREVEAARLDGRAEAAPPEGPGGPGALHRSQHLQLELEPVRSGEQGRRAEQGLPVEAQLRELEGLPRPARVQPEGVGGGGRVLGLLLR